MAILGYITCKKCGERKQVAINSWEIEPDICDECRQKEADEKRKQYFSELDKLTIEERLRKVEEWVYDYKPYQEPFF